ncbi:Tyrosyl-tRNA synthetase [Candidatus Phytoplasma australiense]|uniref:Tyrosine--tRNA ligase n=2 Tax=Phytoplasma australiense TaxID=59748 RepID=SYY_PHYAS|nr:tyrosine--tRNA ligase [Candidatus Phytoplasma australiense]B1VAA7.1 RecName: Full=Tyrosine--tRNA ligase; AltName: Full=Tyrosyl-tRNA synthetase; Short=TyrRS [Candidatus Phytoplasma australiense]CAM11880.1 Tyrosyl-tRNA synthetase [Candidatus Phytoplasma australiense]
MSFYEELKWRNLIKDSSDEKELKNLLDCKKIKFYCGFDPTSDSLTVGHLVQLTMMSLLEKQGHSPFILVGGATGLIGDPKETEERKLLSLETSLQNAKSLETQLKKILFQKKITFLNNYEWFSQLDIITFLRKYGKLFNINYMLNKQTVAKRLSSGISFTEFTYMILQSLDFHHLYKNYGVQLQLGGSDQWGNITSGLELIRKLETTSHAFGLSTPLLLNANGTKFGKSEQDVLWLDPQKTSPYKIYQYFLNLADEEVVNCLKQLTLIPKEEILELEKATLQTPQKRLAQKALANNIVNLIYSQKVLQECHKTNEVLFLNKKKESFQEADFTLLNKTLFSYETSLVSIPLSEALVKTQLTTSKREAREFIQRGSIQIFNEKIKNPDYLIDKKNTLFNKYVLLKKGKKNNSLIILN